jgi:phage shock protein PspC (stress-responsive transcriptional regulator)
MQRVVSINLNGNAYQLEETGYNALFAYLDARETQLQDDPDSAQKMADLERDVAERCQALLTPTKNVITSAEIERIIRELGPRSATDAQSAASSTDSTTGSSASSGSAGPSSGWTHRRLYQVRDGAMISGVCVGLSEYMHIDVTLLRILFVIFALVSAGWGILAYGVLMFILPRVATRAEAASGRTPGATPHHWPWDDGWPWEKHGWPWEHPASAAPPASPPPSSPPSGPSPSTPRDPYAARQAARDARQRARAARREMREQRRAALHDYHPWPVWSTLSMIMFLMFGFFWLSFWTRGHFFFGWPFFWGFPHWIGILFFFLLLRVVFMPVRAARWSSYGYGPYGPYPHPHHAWISMWNGLAWFLVIIFAVWFAYHYIPEVHDAIRDLQMSWSDSSFHV